MNSTNISATWIGGDNMKDCLISKVQASSVYNSNR